MASVREKVIAVDKATSRLPRILGIAILRLTGSLTSYYTDRHTSEVAIDRATAVAATAVLCMLGLWFTDAYVGYRISNIAYGVVISGVGNVYIGISGLLSLKKGSVNGTTKLGKTQAVLLYGESSDSLWNSGERRSDVVGRNTVLVAGFVVFAIGFLVQIAVLLSPPIYTAAGFHGYLLTGSQLNQLLILGVLTALVTIPFKELANIVLNAFGIAIFVISVLYLVFVFVGSASALALFLSIYLIIGISFISFSTYIIIKSIYDRLSTPLETHLKP